jgi:hypothetical protein
VEEGHGKFIALSGTSSSQVTYGIIVMLLMEKALAAGSLSAISGIGIAILAGTAIMLSSASLNPLLSLSLFLLFCGCGWFCQGYQGVATFYGIRLWGRPTALWRRAETSMYHSFSCNRGAFSQ